MKIAILLISEAGRPTAQTLIDEFKYQFYSLHDNGGEKIGSVDALLQKHFNAYDGWIFIGAMGICVRSIAPYIQDKHTDPAVLCVDATGTAIISVLSGHVGGANDLARTVAFALGAQPIITTMSDQMGLWALDTIAGKYGWATFTGDNPSMNEQIALFTSREPTALLLTIRDRGTEWMEHHLPSHVELFAHIEDIDWSKYRLFISVSPVIPQHIDIPFICYIPRVLHIGVGLAHKAQPVDGILTEIFGALQKRGIHREAIASVSTIIDKANEPVIIELKKKLPVTFYSSKELCAVEVPNPNETVMKHMQTPSVSEASALLMSENHSLMVPKTKGEKWTVAVAQAQNSMREGHVEIVGAGPGDPDLVSVRGRKMLEKADLILYAGSLVPRELTDCAKVGCVVRSSASLTLEEQVALMKEFYDKGKFIVRLHTGDPCLYGAIQEQMNLFDTYHINYHITPGISAFQAAAAELRSQFTIPRKVQTIILTRGEGRTPMPDREKLHLLARSHSTMCIYLSADVVEKVQEELLCEYPETTPVAACYRLTWKDQRIYRGQLKDLVQIMRGNHLTLDTLIVVGDAIDNRRGLSELYSKRFTHLFRDAVE